jgi:hypothetical protein
MTDVRIYVVRQDGQKPKLVRAPNKSQAVRYVVNATVKASVATQDEIADLCGDGTLVENATPEE